jgi:hypothetical protein
MFLGVRVVEPVPPLFSLRSVSCVINCSQPLTYVAFHAVNLARTVSADVDTASPVHESSTAAPAFAALSSVFASCCSCMSRSSQQWSATCDLAHRASTPRMHMHACRATACIAYYCIALRRSLSSTCSNCMVQPRSVEQSNTAHLLLLSIHALPCKHIPTLDTSLTLLCLPSLLLLPVLLLLCCPAACSTNNHGLRKAGRQQGLRGCKPGEGRFCASMF